MIHDVGGRPPLHKLSLAGPANTLSVEGTAVLLALGARVVGPTGVDHNTMEHLLGTDSRNPPAKHRILEMYVEHGFEPPDTPVMALHRGRIDMLEAHLAHDPDLLARTFDITDIFPLGPACSAVRYTAQGTPLHGTTLLHIAAYFDELEIAQWLLDRGMDPNARAAIDAERTETTVRRALASFVMFAGIVWHQPILEVQGFVEIAIVANAEGATVALVDVASRTLLGVIDVNPERTIGAGPGRPNYAQDTDLSPDGRTLYVSRGYLGDVAAFDLASGRLLWQRSLDTGRADHMTITPDGRSLFVSAMLDNRVYKIATATGEIAGHLVTGEYPHDVKVSKDGKQLYNTSLGALRSLPRSATAAPLTETPGFPFQLTIADVETLRVRDRIQLEKAFRPWQFSPNEKSIYAQRSNEHGVVAYDVTSRTIIRRLDLPVKPGVTVADWDFEAPHHGLALTENGGTLCLAGRASDYAALVRAQDMTLIATIPVGDAPGWAEVAENGRVCLVANSRSDNLSIISIPNRSEIVRLSIGDGPKHITVARIPEAVIAAFKTRPARGLKTG